MIIKDKIILLSCFFPIFLISIYQMRPDWASALTIFPAWVWLLFSMIFIRKIKLLSTKLWIFLWLIFLWLHVEELRILRSNSITKIDNSLKVITINSSSSLGSIKKFINESYDILLIQESPLKKDLIKLVSKFEEYQLIYGSDASIIARGRLEKQYDESYFISILANINDYKYQIISLRLQTSDPRIDIWNINTWKSQKIIREKQRMQLSMIQSKLDFNLPIILGGDFNVPQNDKIFSLLKEQLIDSYTKCGLGVGNTILSNFPVLRVDQVWLSKKIKCFNGRTHYLEDSDHKAYSLEVLYN